MNDCCYRDGGSMIPETIKPPLKHKSIKADADGYCTLEQIIYHVMRCGLIQGTGEENKIIWNRNIPLAMDRNQNLNLSPSFIWRLALCVIVCPANACEQVGELCWVSAASF